jgi:DNA segregation ATPase FtsK/SpoIIIE-like protein
MLSPAGGQSWKASDFDTAIRGQFSTTVHFQAKDKASSRVLLGDPAAAELDQIGRAYAIIPGRKLIQIQGPALSLRSVCSALPNRIEPPAMPSVPEPEPTELEQKILEMAAEGKSVSAIARAKLGGDGGNQLKRVREILGKFEANRSP